MTIFYSCPKWSTRLQVEVGLAFSYYFAHSAQRMSFSHTTVWYPKTIANWHFFRRTHWCNLHLYWYDMIAFGVTCALAHGQNFCRSCANTETLAVQFWPEKPQKNHTTELPKVRGIFVAKWQPAFLESLSPEYSRQRYWKRHSMQTGRFENSVPVLTWTLQ